MFLLKQLFVHLLRPQVLEDKTDLPTPHPPGLALFFMKLSFMTYFWSSLYIHYEKLPKINILWKSYTYLNVCNTMLAKKKRSNCQGISVQYMVSRHRCKTDVINYQLQIRKSSRRNQSFINWLVFWEYL